MRSEPLPSQARRHVRDEASELARRLAIRSGIVGVALQMKVEPCQLRAVDRREAGDSGVGLTAGERESEPARPDAGAGRDAEADPRVRRPGRQQGQQALQLRRVVDVDQRAVAQRVPKLVIALVGAVENDLLAGVAEPPRQPVLAAGDDLRPGALFLQDARLRDCVVRLERVGDRRRPPQPLERLAQARVAVDEDGAYRRERAESRCAPRVGRTWPGRGRDPERTRRSPPGGRLRRLLPLLRRCHRARRPRCLSSRTRPRRPVRTASCARAPGGAAGRRGRREDRRRPA